VLHSGVIDPVADMGLLELRLSGIKKPVEVLSEQVMRLHDWRFLIYLNLAIICENLALLSYCLAGTEDINHVEVRMNNRFFKLFKADYIL
jgi:hypothetical protein